MKKFIALLLVALMIVPFAACESSDKADFKVGAIYINSKNDTAGYT
jgi:hypothetical protein